MGEIVDRRKYRIHWATYDSQVNLPVIYMMELEDSGRDPLPTDARRWPEVQAHLSAQALGGLKLVTIARGFDEDFDDLHPKRLRRFHLGPMYSNAYTHQNGPLHDVLAEAKAPEGQDWAMVWTEEELLSDRVIGERRVGSPLWNAKYLRSIRWAGSCLILVQHGLSAVSSCRNAPIRFWKNIIRQVLTVCANLWLVQAAVCCSIERCCRDCGTPSTRVFLAK
jgi:hypothetical protein